MKPVLEAAPTHLHYKADDYYHGGSVDEASRSKVDAAMGGKTHTVIPMLSASHDVDPDVEEHLEKHGYAIHDYKSGLASSQKTTGAPERGIPLSTKTVKESIGKVLQKTNAPDFIKNAYANDPARTGAKSSGLHILISHHPFATIGKTSGTNWENESCMNAESGGHRSHLANDSEHLTHEAFLVHPDDEGVKSDRGYPENPIARISLKRFQNENDHSVWRPEESHYGAASSSFHAAINDWAEKAYPAEPGTTYRLHPDLYKDSRDNFSALSDDDAKRIHRGAFGGGTVTDHHINLAINSAIEDDGADIGLSRNSISNLGAISNLKSKHINKIINASSDKNKAAFILAPKHGEKFSSNAIERTRIHAATSNADLPDAILKNKRLPDAAIDSLDAGQLADIPSSRLKPQHVDRLVDYAVNGGSDYGVNRHSDLLSADHITKLLKRTYKNINGDDVLTMHRYGHIPVAATAKNSNQDHADFISDNWDKINPPEKIGYLSTTKHITNHMFYGKNLSSVTSITNAIHRNPHLSDSIKNKATNEFVLHAENSEPSATSSKSHIVLTGASKLFTNEHVERMADAGVYQARDSELSGRLADAHVSKAQAAADHWESKMNEMDDEHKNFDNPEYERLHNETANAIDNAYQIAGNHADSHGASDGRAYKHLLKFESIAHQTDGAHDADTSAYDGGAPRIKAAIDAHRLRQN